MSPKTCRVVVALAAIILLPASAAADLPCPDLAQCVLNLTEGATTPRGLILPPGYYLTRETREAEDAEIRRLQETETRLTAERDSLAKSSQPPWVWVAAALIVGAATGAGVRWALK